MISLQWPMINFVTISMYFSILIFLPINPTYSTLFLFAIIAFWSRLPSVGSPPPFGEVLWLFDVVDMFSLIIAINLGGLTGSLFSILINLGSRFVGSYPDIISVLKDTVSQGIVCLIIPFIHVITGENIALSMIWYSVLRLLFYFPMRIFYARFPLPEAIIRIGGGGILIAIVNEIYTAMFGKFLDRLLKSGVKFNWLLFLLVSLAIGGTKIYFQLIKKKKIKPFKLKLT